MTCEQFQALCQSGPIDETRYEDRIEGFHHFAECPDCQDWLAQMPEDLTPQREAEIDALGEADLRREIAENN